ncbi:MAG TPA: Rieske 2Fe-2S domain-containing protein, partial [Opitutaceae bacterium]
ECSFPEERWRALARQWHPIEIVEGIGSEPIAVLLADQRVVVWRTPSGLSAAWDVCIHRGAQLSPGSIVDGELVCPYHGFRYSASGACTLAPCTGSPQTALPSRLHLRMFAVAESGGLAWVRLAEGGPTASPALLDPAKGDVWQSLVWNASAQRAVECLIGLRERSDFLGPYTGSLEGGSAAFAVQPTSRGRCRIWVSGRTTAAIVDALGPLRPVVESQAPEPASDEVDCLPRDAEIGRFRAWLSSLGLG